MTRVALVAKPGQPHTGVGRYARMLERGLHQEGVDVIQVAPSTAFLPAPVSTALRRMGLDARTFFTNFPVWAPYPRADVYHLTSQNLASILMVRRPHGRVVVTVHDIIPYMLRDDPELRSYRTKADRFFDRLAMRGLRRADHLMSDSHFTRRCLVEHLALPADRIDVVHLGIDHERFQPQPVPPALFERYGLARERSYLLYTGSEDPRKNLPTLIRALARLRADRAEVELIKVGRAHFTAQREHLLALAGELGVHAAVHFLDDVPEDDLPLLYNLADVCVMPSLYEGFGFPVLEAMACGTPVVCARAASLPELVDDAALLFDPGPDAVTQICSAVAAVLDRPEVQSDLRRRGIARAERFRWPTCTRQVLRAYGHACAQGTEEMRLGETA
jgi:glycosyltransferase involved in cell wall biosynthesis